MFLNQGRIFLSSAKGWEKIHTKSYLNKNLFKDNSED